jgi:hypothetical protein
MLSPTCTVISPGKVTRLKSPDPQAAHLRIEFLTFGEVLFGEVLFGEGEICGQAGEIFQHRKVREVELHLRPVVGVGLS